MSIKTEKDSQGNQKFYISGEELKEYQELYDKSRALEEESRNVSKAMTEWLRNKVSAPEGWTYALMGPSKDASGAVSISGQFNNPAYGPLGKIPTH